MVPSSSAPSFRILTRPSKSGRDRAPLARISGPQVPMISFVSAIAGQGISSRPQSSICRSTSPEMGPLRANCWTVTSRSSSPKRGQIESLALDRGDLKPAPAGKEFKGPRQLFVGEYEYAVCRGDCGGTYDMKGIKKSLYLAEKAVEVYLQLESGRGLTLSSNATAGYRMPFDVCRLHASGL